jgi:hypothetical protein
MTRIHVTPRMIPILALSLFVLACTDDTVSDEQSSETGSADTSTPGDGDDDPGDGDDDPGDGDGDPGDGDPGDGDPGDGDPGDGDPGDGDPGDGDPGDGGIEAACKDLCTISNMCDGVDPECEWECLDIFDWFGRECAPFMISLTECIAALDCAGYDAWGTGDPFGGPDYPCKAEDLAVLSCGL